MLTQLFPTRLKYRQECIISPANLALYWAAQRHFECITVHVYAYIRRREKKKPFSKWTESRFGNSLHFDELVFPVMAALKRGLQSLCVFNMHVFYLRVQLSMHGCVCFQTSLLFSLGWTLCQYLWTWMTVFKLNTDLCHQNKIDLNGYCLIHTEDFIF